MKVEFINPFITATNEVFETMLNTSLERGQLSLKHEHTPVHEVSGLIGLSGRCKGMVVVGVDRHTAISAAEMMLGFRPAELDRDVLDAMGELTNMIVGSAKSKLEEFKLTIGLPTVICGKVQAIAFPSAVTPIVIPFDSNIGPISVQVGLVETLAV